MTTPGAVALLAFALLQDPAPSPSATPELSVCSVLANWRDHHGDTVRMSGSYRGGFERSALSGPGCRGRVWVSWPSVKDPSLDEAMKKMRAGGGGLSGVPVVVEGVFHGPFPRPDGTVARYGHLGGYVGELEVTKVVRVGKDGSDR